MNNRTGHFLSHKYWICLLVLFSITTFLMIIKNKQKLIRYCNTSFFVVIFRNGNTEKACEYFINYCHIVDVGISWLLSLLVSCRCCWRLGCGASSSKSLLLASRCCHCFVIVDSGVPSCGCVRRILLLIVGGVLFLSSATASPQSKLIYPFVIKFQQIIGTNREVFERV